MAFASYKRLLFLNICWSLTMTSHNINDNDIQHLEGNVLRISCGVINSASVSNPIQISIFEDTPTNTLVSKVFKKCHSVQDSGKDKNIYLDECVKHGDNMSVDIVLGNYNPTGNKYFGCNYMYIVAEGQPFNYVPLATVSSSDNSSPTANSKNELPAIPEGRPEVNEGTSSSTERHDKSIDDHGETCGRHDTWSLVLNTFECALLLIIVYKLCWKSKSKLNCSHLCSCGKTAQAKSKKSEYSKHDEHEDNDECTTINKAKKRDNCDECTVVNRLNSSLDNVSEMSVRLKTANLSPEIVNDEEEYQDGISYTQVKKSPMPETCVHIPLMD